VVADPLNISTTAVETHSGHIVQGFGLHIVSSFAAPSSSVRNNALLGEVGSRGHEVGFDTELVYGCAVSVVCLDRLSALRNAVDHFQARSSSI
jgi:class 3 adenylate cyclase